MPERGIESDHHPEVVEGGKGTRRLELLGTREIFADRAARRAFFGNLDDDHYAKTLGYINSVVRHEPVQYEYGDASTFSLATPSVADKAPLMQRSFETVRSILSQELLDDETATRRAALTLAGSLVYIHPYANGNGRTGRVAHYLVEFGAERGDEAFNNELYAIIGKIPIYDSHDMRTGAALRDAPQPALTQALDKVARSRNPERWATLDEATQATERVVVFLDMMRSVISVPIDQDVRRLPRDPVSGEPHEPPVIPAGTLDGLAFYERDYLDRSAIPNYNPADLPETAQRIIARRKTGDPIPWTPGFWDIV